MRTRLEPLEGNRVKLSVEVDEREFDEAVDAALRRIASQVRVPGFRPGKAPRRLLEARLGPEAVREEALRESLPDYYERAVEESGLEPIASPEIDITSGREGGPVAFDAVVEVRPQVRIGGYDGLRVVIPSPHIDESDVEYQIDRLREQFGELQAVARPAGAGDFVAMDRRVYRHDETLSVTEDELYQVGKGSIAPELDEQLRGARAGDILKFNATLPDLGEVSIQVLVKEVRERVLPPVTDEWASEASEFETVAELREDVRSRLARLKQFQAVLARREKVLEALVELVDEDVPASLLEAEVDRRVVDLRRRLDEQGSDLDTHLRNVGQTEEELREHLREHAVRTVKAELALRAVAEAEGLEATEEDVQADIDQLAAEVGEDPVRVRQRLDRAGRLPAVRSDIRRRKALEWLIDHTEVVDEEGRVIDRSELAPPKPEGTEGITPFAPAAGQGTGS